MAVTARFFVRPTLFLFILLFLIPPQTYSLSESESLLRLKNSLKNANLALASWGPGSTPCSKQNPWNGLICSKGRVTGLRLKGMGLSGKIDVDALAGVEGLRTISFVNNSISGPIPEFNRLGTLRGIFLSWNQFEGEISQDYFSKMESLKKIWLSHNKFTGKLPESLAQIPRLRELHVEDNEFSGTIPSLNGTFLKSVNMSNNKLEGEIPASLSKFDVSRFAGNAGMCGEKLGKECRKPDEKPADSNNNAAPPNNNEPSTSSSDDSGNTAKNIAAAVTSGVVILSIIALLVRYRSRRKMEDFDKLGKENAEEPLEVHVAAESITSKKEVESLKRAASSSARKGSNHGKGGGGGGEVIVVNDEKGMFGLPDLMKAAAEVLGNGGLGSSYKAVLANGVAVVVKRMREMNAIGKVGFDAEMRRLGKLKHWNILTPLAYLYRKDEKLLVYEYVPKGSLLYLLHGDRGPSHAELNWPARLKIVQGIAKGMGFLHTELSSLDLPHGNLKSSNVLLGPDYEPLISDFGFSQMINPANLSQALFAYKSPEASQFNKVSHKSDVYCLGILVLEILTGKYPSQYLNTGKGGINVVQWVQSAISEGRELELLDPEIASSRDSIGEMEKLLQIGADCTESDPHKRLDMMEAIIRIEEIKSEGSGRDESGADNRTIQELPSLRDGYADSVIVHEQDDQELRI